MNATPAPPHIELERLAAVLPRLLGSDHALPEDWEPVATTYDLPLLESQPLKAPLPGEWSTDRGAESLLRPTRKLP